MDVLSSFMSIMLIAATAYGIRLFLKGFNIENINENRIKKNREMNEND